MHRYFFYIGTAFLSWILKKEDKLIVIDHGSKCENLKALKEYFLLNKVQFYEIGVSKYLSPNTFMAMIYLARCKWLIIDCDSYNLGPRQLRIFYKIDYFDVWHATGLKQILNDSPIANSKWNYLWFGWKRLICASSFEDFKLKKSGYGPLAKIKITGSPQTDILLEAKSIKMNNVIKKILYAPSFLDFNKKYLDPIIFENLD